MAGLNGRLRRLEAAMLPVAAVTCRTCGLEHARKVTIAEMRALIRVMGGTDVPGSPPGAVRPGPFCLCDCCTEYRSLAEWTHVG